MSYGKGWMGGCGTQTAGLGFGGYSGSFTNVTEEYDGASWASGGNISANSYGMGGAGTQTSGLRFGGVLSGSIFVNTTEEYDGSSWTTGGSLSEGKGEIGGCGTQSAGLGFGGYYGSGSSYLTEEYA